MIAATACTGEYLRPGSVPQAYRTVPEDKAKTHIVCSRCEMTHHLADDQVLSRFRAALAETYGDRLERAVLFGSRARGDARPDSDYDIAVFIRDPDAWFEEVVRLAELGADILMDTGAVISAKPFRAGAYREPLPLMEVIRSEGLDL